MIKYINIWKGIRALHIGGVVRSLLYKYIDWERMWYNPKNKHKKGDKLKLSWRYKYYFKKKDNRVFVFDKIDKDNVVDLECGNTFNLYWLTKF